jgi:hypothetical protein
MRRQAGAVLGAGLLLLVVVHLVGGPATMPLFDGVVVEEAYRYVSPPPGAQGNPGSAMDRVSPQGDTAPNIYSATTEQPPQAQLIVDQASITLPPGTSVVIVEISPIPPPDPAPPPTLAGNVYRMSLTNQDGTPIEINPGATATVVLRTPPAITSGTIYALSNGTWVAQSTQNGGLPDMFSANVSSLGEFAVVTQQAIASSSPSAVGGSAAPVPLPVPGGGGGPPILTIVAIVLGTLAFGLLAVAATLNRRA